MDKLTFEGFITLVTILVTVWAYARIYLNRRKEKHGTTPAIGTTTPIVTASKHHRAVEAILTTSTVPTVAQKPAQLVTRTMPRKEWLHIANNELDRACATMVIAEAGAGKTVISSEILKLRHGYKLILDPKIRKGKWTNAPYVTRDKDGTLSSIEEALKAAEAEMMERLQDTGKEYTPLTVFIDEYPTIVDEIKDAAYIIKRLYRIGREVRVRPFIVSQSDLVQDLGINSKMRDGFSFIYLGDRAIQVCKESASMEYPTAIEWKGAYYPIDNSGFDTADAMKIEGIWKPELANINVQHTVYTPPTDRQTTVQTALDGFTTLTNSAGVKTDKLHDLTTRQGLVLFLKAQGLTVSDIRKLIKGDNNELSQIFNKDTL